MKKINIRESLLNMDRETDCKYDLTSLYESCKLDDEKKKEICQYIDKYDIEATNRFLSNEAASQGLMENASDDISDEQLQEWYDEENDWKELACKQVKDSDDFWTEYTLYVNADGDKFICMFGDRDFYPADESYADFETESEEEAWEWFNSYNGLMDDEDDDYELLEATTKEVEIPKGANHIHYKDNEPVMGADACVYSLAELMDYWNNNHYEDPVLAEYDSYDDWWADTQKHLSLIESLNEDSDLIPIEIIPDNRPKKYFIGEKEVPYTSYEEAREHIDDFNIAEYRDELNQFLADNGLKYIDVDVIRRNGKDVLYVDIANGDWKHEHIALSNAVWNFFINKGLLVKADKEEYGYSEDDTYSAEYFFDINDICFSERPVKESLEEDLEDEWKAVCKEYCKQNNYELLFIRDDSFGFETPSGQMIHMYADELQAALSEDFKPGDQVFCKANKKVGTVKLVKGDNVEVEFTGGEDPDRIDTYYKQDLQLNEDVVKSWDDMDWDEQIVCIRQFIKSYKGTKVFEDFAAYMNVDVLDVVDAFADAEAYGDIKIPQRKQMDSEFANDDIYEKVEQPAEEVVESLKPAKRTLDEGWFSDDDFEDDMMHTDLYGGDPMYCRTCGSKIDYSDGYGFCPKCNPQDDELEYVGEESIVDPDDLKFISNRYREDDPGFDEYDLNESKNVGVAVDAEAPEEYSENDIENTVTKALDKTPVNVSGYMEVHSLDEDLEDDLEKRYRPSNISSRQLDKLTSSEVVQSVEVVTMYDNEVAKLTSVDGKVFFLVPSTLSQFDVYDEAESLVATNLFTSEIPNELLDTREANYTYQVVGGEYAGNYTREEIEALPCFSGQYTKEDRYSKPELINQPILDGYLTPMFNGWRENHTACIRYETQEVYDMMSEATDLSSKKGTLGNLISSNNDLIKTFTTKEEIINFLIDIEPQCTNKKYLNKVKMDIIHSKNFMRAMQYLYDAMLKGDGLGSIEKEIRGNKYRYAYEGLNEGEENPEQEEDDIKELEQEFSSKDTSINSSKLPAVFKLVHFNPGTTNLDYGGGKFDNVAEYLAQEDVTNLVYDPYNRSQEHNREVIATIRKNGGADTVTCSNVLNVIKEEEVRLNVLNNIKKLVKPNGTVYITVYEGSGANQGAATKAGYQLNRKTADYLEEIQQVFPDATRKGKLIVAHPGKGVSESLEEAVDENWAVFATDKSTGKEYCAGVYEDRHYAGYWAAMDRQADVEYQYGDFKYRVEQVPEYTQEMVDSQRELNALKIANHEASQEELRTAFDEDFDDDIEVDVNEDQLTIDTGVAAFELVEEKLAEQGYSEIYTELIGDEEEEFFAEKDELLYSAKYDFQNLLQQFYKIAHSCDQEDAIEKCADIYLNTILSSLKCEDELDENLTEAKTGIPYKGYTICYGCHGTDRWYIKDSWGEFLGTKSGYSTEEEATEYIDDELAND